MSKAHAQYTTMMKDFCAPALPTTLKVASGVNGFKVMDPFDWTKDRNVITVYFNRQMKRCF